jgi:hypothetical protein
VFAGAFVTAHDTFDILIFDIADLRSIRASDRRRSGSRGVVVIGRRVVVVIQRSIGAVVHAIGV